MTSCIPLRSVRRLKIFPLVLGMLIFSCPLLRGRQNAPQTSVIVGGTLIDGTGKPPLDDAIIVIEGDRIRSVGQKGRLNYPQTSKVIDAAGKFIIPGLFDSHVHYRNWMAETFLAYGVTSVIDMGSPTEWIVAVRDGIAKGEIAGPRIFTSGDAMDFRYQNAPAGASLPPEELAKLRKAVRELIAQGVDQITITIRQDPRTYPILIEEAHKAGIPVSAYSAYPQKAIAEGLDGLQHSYTLAAGSKKEDSAVLQVIREETQARNEPYYRKHTMNYFIEQDNDDWVRFLARHPTYVIPSLIFEYKLINDHREQYERENFVLLTNPSLRYMPVDDWLPQLMSYSHAGIPRLGGPGFFGALDFEGKEFQRYREGYRTEQTFLRKLEQAGGKILAGTDAPNSVLGGISLHHELQLLVDAGLSPMQAILAATRDPATFIRKQQLLGTIEPGKLADLVILGADPLHDIANTRKVELVMKNGRLLDTSYHADFPDPIPRPLLEYHWNPVPAVTVLSPKMATEGDGEVSLSVSGRGFIGIRKGDSSYSSVVLFDGVPIPTVFISDTELQSKIPARLLHRVGTFRVQVSNPRPIGGISNEAKFLVKFR